MYLLENKWSPSLSDILKNRLNFLITTTDRLFSRVMNLYKKKISNNNDIFSHLINTKQMHNKSDDLHLLADN